LAIGTITLVSNLISTMDNLLEKFPSYDEQKKKDYLELKANFESYKRRPKWRRVHRYVMNLSLEISNHVKSISEVIQ